MKHLNTYINEGLFKNVGIGSTVLKQEIANWINEIYYIEIFVKGIAQSYEIQEQNIITDSKYGFITNFDNVVDSPNLVRIGIKVRSQKNLTDLTNGKFRWGEVGSFKCNDCENLKSLEGAPIKCYDFECENCNKLTSLKGMGECELLRVKGQSLKDLTGVPKSLKELRMRNCRELTSLKGLPNKMDYVWIEWCAKLKDLVGAPKEVTTKFICRLCIGLESTKGCPQKVRDLILKKCDKLKDLSSLPKTCEILDLYAIGIHRKATKKAEVDKYCKPKKYFE